MTDKIDETRQLRFWRSDLGDAYIERNAVTEEKVQARTALWSRILRGTVGDPPTSILEVGANVGVNLRALRRLTSATLRALEPNSKARETLLADGVVAVDHLFDGVAATIPLPHEAVDLVFTSGVLMHIAPQHLLESCREIHRVTNRYIACVEYFSVEPQEVRYGNQNGMLFKRDFGSFWLDNFSDLRTLDYGFAWKRATGLDNLTWWLFEKRP